VLLSAVAARAEQGAEGGPLLISSSSEVHGSVLSDTIVQRNCTLHVRGNLLGSLTIEPGANVIVEGSVDGKINNKGGRLLVNNKGLAACVTVEGPPEAEACGILKINLTNLAANYESATSRQLQVLIGGHRCPVAAPPSMDLLPIDVTDLPDRSVARFGAMVTLIGDDIGLDDLALASGTTGREILARLGRRFHRIYYAT
jgi:hypothetical protein